MRGLVLGLLCVDSGVGEVGIVLCVDSGVGIGITFDGKHRFVAGNRLVFTDVTSIDRQKKDRKM